MDTIFFLSWNLLLFIIIIILDVLASNIKIVIVCYLETINDTKISNHAVL